MLRRSLLLARLLPSGALAPACRDLDLLRSSHQLLSLSSLPCSSSSSSNGHGSGGSSSCSGSSSSDGSAPAGIRSSRPRSLHCHGLLASGCAWQCYTTAAAAAGTAEAGGSPGAAANKSPLWRFLRQCGFSEAGISRMRGAVRSRKSKYKVVAGTRFSQRKIAQDLAPNIAALLGEGLDTCTIEQLFVKQPGLLNATHRKFTSALAAVRQLAALLPDDPAAAQAPAGSTQLGAALWRYPGSAARLLQRGVKPCLIDSNLQLRLRLGVSLGATARAVFKNQAVLAANLRQAEAMAAHLQRLQAAGELSAEQVARAALDPGVLGLTPAEFHSRWRKGSDQTLQCISLRDPASRQQVAAAAVGELLQEADGVHGPLLQYFQEQGAALVQHCAPLVRASPASLRANWAALRRLGLTNGRVAKAVQQQPSILTTNWKGPAKQLQAAWLQRELGIGLKEFIRQHAGYANKGVRRLALRAAYLQQHQPAVWQEFRARGTGPLLSLLTDNRTFFARCGCDQAELDAFEREWRQTPDGRRWGSQPSRQ